ncbi:MAG: hypothetical protein IJG37_00685, partial [Synergistaceae bacterium]|nr:hypothetical protein [Synergistaceae bacterium]
GVLIDGKSLLGLFVIECVFMFLCARVVYALMSRFAGGKTPLIGTQIFLVFAMFRGTFAREGMTENYALLFQILGVYVLVKDGGKFSCLHMFIQGVLVGIVLCFQANIAMMWGGIALVAGYELLKRGDLVRLAGNVIAGILGVLAGVMPAVVYAVMNDAVSDVAFGMFGYNFMYLNVPETGNFAATFGRRMLGAFMPGGEIQVSAPAYAMVVFVAASCAVVVRRWGKSRLTAYYSAMLAMTFAGVALSGRNFGHYYESLAPFCVPAALWLALKVRPGRFRLAVVAVMVAGVLAGVKIPDWVKELAGRKFMRMDEFVSRNEPYHSENERVLVTGNRAEFYERFGVIPQEKYFYVLGSFGDFSAPTEAYISSILSGVNDVVVAVYPKDRGEISRRLEEARRLPGILRRTMTFSTAERTALEGTSCTGGNAGRASLRAGFISA